MDVHNYVVLHMINECIRWTVAEEDSSKEIEHLLEAMTKRYIMRDGAPEVLNLSLQLNIYKFLCDDPCRSSSGSEFFTIHERRQFPIVSTRTDSSTFALNKRSHG